VNGAENVRYNKIHWILYIENPSGSYKILLNEFSSYNKEWWKSKFLQVYKIKVKTDKENNFRNFLEKYESVLKKVLNDNSFVWMRTISGGSVSEYCLFIGLNNISDYKLFENLFDFSNSDDDLIKDYSVEMNESELWGFNKELSM
jgi:hypothetical protein